MVGRVTTKSNSQAIVFYKIKIHELLRWPRPVAQPKSGCLWTLPEAPTLPGLRCKFQLGLESGARCQPNQQVHAESVDFAPLQIRHACLSHSKYLGGLG